MKSTLLASSALALVLSTGIAFAGPTATISASSMPLPTVPPGGVPLILKQTTFHSSGVLSIPQLVDWEPPAQSPEESILPTATTPFTRFALTFINSGAGSVIHAFAERDPERKAGDKKVASVQDLDAYFDKKALDKAWEKFTGGWKELGRKVEGDHFSIDFELSFESNTYRGRQISRLSGDWLIVLRLVAPANYPELLDRLQEVIFPDFRLWPEALVAPLDWNAVTDTLAGYMIRYPADWQKVDGKPGQPFTIMGKLFNDTITLTTRSAPGQSARTEAEARAWVKATWPRATVQTIRAETRSAASGFTLSYIDPDPDGNQLSAAVTLLNGANGTLYVANMQSTARGLDLLDVNNVNVPKPLAEVRASFFVVAADQLIKTPTPVPTPTPLPGAPATASPTPAG